MGEKMKNAPIYYAIAQIRYNPILSLETYLSDIQDKFRKAGYPGFNKIRAMTFNLAPLSEGKFSSEQVPQFQQTGRYVFSNIEETAGFILEQNSLSFQTTDYDTYNKFSQTLFQGLEFLHQIVNLSFTERVGIRFLDAVKPHKDENINQYFIPEVLGVCGKLEGEAIHSFSESRNRIKAGSLITRVIIQNSLLGFPPDLQLLGLQVLPQFSQINGTHGIIDTDGFYDSREAFNLKQVENHLSLLHDEIIKAFKTVVTDYALKVWK